MAIKQRLRKYLWKIGFDLSRFNPASHPIARQKRLFKLSDIDTVLDIGANLGQFALFLRHDLGYRGHIFSFEPTKTAFHHLKASADKDPAWEVMNIALGDVKARKDINLSQNSHSSSLRQILPVHLKAAPDSHFVGTEQIQMTTLDSIFPELFRESRHIYMKIDTQGFERNVLEGAEVSLQSIDIVQMEMSLIPLYEGETLFLELCDLMIQKGFQLFSLDAGFADPNSGRLLQVDGIFQRI